MSVTISTFQLQIRLKLESGSDEEMIGTKTKPSRFCILSFCTVWKYSQNNCHWKQKSSTLLNGTETLPILLYLLLMNWTEAKVDVYAKLETKHSAS